MSCPYPSPERLREAVAELINRTPAAERPLLRARLYRETPAEGLLEVLELEPKRRCSVCWKLRSERLRWKEYREEHRYTCDSLVCQRLWRRLRLTEEEAQAEAQARLVHTVSGGVAA